ncbi:MAG: L,D-transpeptidase family protein [Acidobacteriaceae bacterium]
MKIRKLAVFAFFALVCFTWQTFSATAPPLRASAVADKVLVLKRQRKLYLIQGSKVLKRYSVSLGGHPIGPKIREGDRKTPEGKYVLDWHNSESQFYKSIHISYPNATDLSRAKKLDVSPGGDLFIHGQPNEFSAPGKQPGDWTDGCIAVSNEEMDEIWRAVADGTPIEIKR